MARRRDDDAKKPLLADDSLAEKDEAAAKEADLRKLREELASVEEALSQLSVYLAETGDRDTDLLYLRKETEDRKRAIQAALAAAERRGKGSAVGYKLRKAPRRELYWVVSKEDGRHHSKEPLPLERAKAQMRALYAAKGSAEGKDLKGRGTLDERRYKELVRLIPTRDVYDAKFRKSPAYRDKPYDEFRREAEETARQRATVAGPGDAATPMRCPAAQKYDPEREYGLDDQICMEVPDASVPGGVKLSYGPVRSFLPEGADPDPVEFCRVGKNSLGNMKRSECARLTAEAKEQALANEPEYQKVFRKINEGLTKIADVGVEAVGSMLPGVGKFVAEAYKTFAPPGSQYYQEGTIAEKAMRRLEGQGVPPVIRMPRKKFLAEHKRLIRVLTEGTPAERKAEAADQAAELKGEGPKDLAKYVASKPFSDVALARQLGMDRAVPLVELRDKAERAEIKGKDPVERLLDVGKRRGRQTPESPRGVSPFHPARPFEDAARRVGSGSSEAKFLAAARKKAKEAGLAWRTLRASSKPGKKLQITAPDGRTVHFGAAGMGDFIHYTLAKDPAAEEHRRRYRARATKIRGNWKADPYSPNSLALAVLW